MWRPIEQPSNIYDALLKLASLVEVILNPPEGNVVVMPARGRSRRICSCGTNETD